MNLKKWVFTLSAAVLLSGTAALAQTAPQTQEPDMTKILQQYQEATAKLNKQFDEKLLPPVKGLTSLLVKIQNSGQTELTPDQELEIEAYSQQIDNNLTALVTPIVKELDIAQLNTQYQQMMKEAGVPNPPTLTKEMATEMFKGMYILGALTHFEEAQKLTQEELEVAVALFFPSNEDEQAAQ